MSATDPITEFEALTAGLRRVPALDAMYGAAEDQLQAEHPEGYYPEDIGRLAWNSLPEAERTEALDQLLYTYWAARENDRVATARWEQEHDTKTRLRFLLGEYRLLTDMGCPLSRELVAEIAELSSTLIDGA